ncbi:MAG TPA: LuxR C-terminal-related transcriptional regulator, partial [Ktedonobacterales bacterium]|nr:LuxR C-terminal-related transcriptional regulator [Ktedonobacterales bacterium]
VGEVITCLTIRALAHSRRHEHEEAIGALRAALVLAHAEGYQRTFVDEGAALGDLLRTAAPALKGDIPPAYLRALLVAFVSSQGASEVDPRTATPFAEPLSPQEQRVLRLLAEGRTNPEIAGILVVSVNTVKTQTQSIFRKLGVSSRREARDVARSAGL